jgi:hypothetical protein
MYNLIKSRDKLPFKNLNSVRNSDKLKNPAAQGSREFFSLSTGAAEFLIFLILRVLLQFFISRDLMRLYMVFAYSLVI